MPTVRRLGDGRLWALLTVALASAGCGLRLGRPSPLPSVSFPGPAAKATIVAVFRGHASPSGGIEFVPFPGPSVRAADFPGWRGISLSGAASWDSEAKTISGTVTVANSRNQPLFNVKAIVTYISASGVAVANADGTTDSPYPVGKPYWDYGDIEGDGSAQRTWSFSDPDAVPFDFVVEIWADAWFGEHGALYGVFFVSQSEGWVGGVGGRLLHTTDGGASWEELDSRTSLGITDFDFVSATEGWAVGWYGLVLHTTDGGQTWRVVKVSDEEPVPGVSPWFTHYQGVDFVESQNGWIVGERGVILRTSDGGETWTVQSGYDETKPSYWDVCFVSASCGWVVGYTGTLDSPGQAVVLHTSDGGQNWTTQLSLSGVGLEGVDFVDSQTGWVVGHDGTIYHTADGGQSWSKQTSGVANDLFAVDFVDSQNGWVVGRGGVVLRTADGGGTWSREPSEPHGWALFDVSAVSPDLAFAVGGMVLKLEPSSTETALAGTSKVLNDLDFVGSDLGWAVGYGGVIVRTSDGGGTWTLLDSGTSADLFGVDFVDSQNGWAVGSGGTILHTTDGGASWSPQSSGTTATLRAVQFLDALEGWAVGDGGVVLHTTDGGQNWTTVNSGTTENLYGLCFVSGAAGWAVGGSGTVLKWDGASWAAQESGVTCDLYCVFFVDENTGCAGGGTATDVYGSGDAVIIGTSDGGQNWATQLSASGKGVIYGIHFLDSQTGWAVSGWPGRVWRTTDGSTWTEMTWFLKPLNAVHAVSAHSVWAVGHHGLIVHFR